MDLVPSDILSAFRLICSLLIPQNQAHLLAIIMFFDKFDILYTKFLSN